MSWRVAQAQALADTALRQEVCREVLRRLGVPVVETVPDFWEAWIVHGRQNVAVAAMRAVMCDWSIEDVRAYHEELYRNTRAGREVWSCNHGALREQHDEKIIAKGFATLSDADKLRVLRYLDTEIAVRGGSEGDSFARALGAVRETLLQHAPVGYDRDHGEPQDPMEDVW